MNVSAPCYRTIARALSALWLLCLLALCGLAAFGQTPSEPKTEGTTTTNTPQTAGNAPSKVAVLVLPESADSARIALTYNRRVGRRRVQQDITSLARSAGGSLSGKVEIKDYSLDPHNLRRFPVTTSAEFTLIHSPQFQDDAPRVLPYLQAFRQWRSLDVLFQLPGATESAGPMQFQSKAMSVWFFRDVGVYRYHAEIAAGEATLPIPTFLSGASASTTTDSISVSGTGAVSTERPTTSAPSSWPMLLIIAGVGLVCGAGLYLLALRRSGRNVSPHPQ